MPKDISNLLRETKIGQKGFLREDVLNYIDELQTKIEDLEKDVSENQRKGGSSSNNKQLEGIIKTLEGKLKMSDAALANERQSREKERQQYEDKLRKATSTTGYNPENEKQIKQKDELIQQKDQEIILMQEKVQQVKDFLVEKEESMNILNDTIDKLKAENQELSNLIENDDSKHTIDELKATNIGLNKEIDALKAKVNELSDIDESKLAMTYMASLIENAKNTAENLTNDAQNKANEILEEAEKVKTEASEQAEKTIAEASETAEKTISEANEKASKIISDAEIAVNKKAVAINEKSDKVEADAQAFKTIVMEQIGNINENLANVIELINSANDKVNQVGEKISNNDTLNELVSNLPKEEVSELFSSTIETTNVDNTETITSFEDNTPSKKIVDLDDLDDLSEFIITPKKPNDFNKKEKETPLSKSQKKDFNLDGLDDLLKAVEESTEDETMEEL